jgi:Cd2+/Zn2+-exporting ATPase
MTHQTLELRVANLDCEHDAAALERGLTGTGGLEALKIYPSAAKVLLTYDPAVTSADALKETLGDLGFPAREGFALPQQPRPWRNPKVLAAVASGLLLLAGWLVSLGGAPAPWPALLYVAAILIGGYYFGREALEALIFEHTIGIELLMTIAALVAALLGQLPEAAMLVFLYAISEAVEGYTEEKTRSAVKSLMALAPQEALVRRDGVEQTIPAADLQAGDLFIVKPGGTVPTDGVVLAGLSSLNQAPITGESVPVDKGPGDELFAGSLNGAGALDVRATTPFSDNTIARIITMVEEAQERKGQSQRFIERFGAIYSPLVLLLGLLIAVLPPLLFGQEWMTWLTRATVFIVAAAPCALVISIPITMVATLGTGARQGVLIKGGIIVEQLARVQAVALDKTGTITAGEPQVTDIMPCAAADETQVLPLAAALEARSEHPLARAVLRRAAAEGITPLPVTDFQALPGAGAEAIYEGQRVLIGSPALFDGLISQECAAAVERLQGEGKTAVLVGSPTAVYGLIAIRDEVRANARTAVQALHDLGLSPIAMLTGDNAHTAQAIAQQAGVDLVYADLKPEDKVSRVRELEAAAGHVAMVGDGVNDAPALAAAHVGVAMGAIGTDVALETADVALMADDLEKLVYAIELARRSRRVVRQNLVLAIAVISLLSLGAVLGLLSLPAAVLAHEISEFVVIGSGLRMLRA